ncbi:MAG: hypothetical protein UY41_C0007G0006 [Candidatus Moranbacteria bacterium GW2011_GWE1_49_15]|nr:MAG: hypothetical protein UX75_C0009G0019 [Candidatus Moranbacteria bacterium GW2011_GWE2_47_10]KKW07234.1 MAG: hypothetical protein UY41_C0007G0006 [Candidatus Moranbacteria bacterium GW2011_GWE1_49_15]HBP01568.1 hypothetical protein [Candidatus Moranbacteria bacterium]
MRIEWSDRDDLMKFEVILEKIRTKELQNVTVRFTENAGILRYELEADIDSDLIAGALGFRKRPS